MNLGLQRIQKAAAVALAGHAPLAVADDRDEREKVRRGLHDAIILAAVLGIGELLAEAEHRRPPRYVLAQDPMEYAKALSKNDPVASHALDGVSHRADEAAAAAVMVWAMWIGRRRPEWMTDAILRDGAEAVANGRVTFPDDEVRQAAGLVRAARSHLGGISDYALSSSYHESIASLAVQPELERAFPLWRIDETMDEVTRGNPQGRYPEPYRHWQMTGYVHTMRRIRAQRCVPPNGAHCRGTMNPVAAERAKAEGWLDAAGKVDERALAAYNGDRQRLIDEGVYPDDYTRP